MKKLILLVVCLTMVAFVSGAMAQQKAEPAKPPATAAPAPAPEKAKEMKMEKFSGIVEKVDEAAKAVAVKNKKGENTFMIDDKTKITKGKSEMSLADLKKGMNVSVSYKKDGDKMVAADIKIAVPKAVKKVEKKEKPAVEKPAVEKPAVEKPAVEKPAVEKPAEMPKK